MARLVTRCSWALGPGAPSLSVALMLLTTPVLAQQADPTQGNEPEPAAQCPPAPEPSLQGRARAEALSRRFECLFAAGQYQACLPVLDEACKLTDAPRCLYSLAVVHHALFHCELAASYYESYLSRDPYDSVRDEAVSALNELRRICGQPESAPPPPSPAAEDAIHPLDEHASVAAPQAAFVPPPVFAPTPAPTPRERPSPVRKVLAFSTLGAGVATAVATAVFASYGQRAESDINVRARMLDNVADDEARALDENGKRYNTLAWVFFGSSVALLGASVTLFVLDAQSEQSLDVATDGSLSVRYRGSF